MPHPDRKLDRNLEIYVRNVFGHVPKYHLSKEYHISNSRIEQIIKNIEHHLYNCNANYMQDVVNTKHHLGL